MNVGRKKNKAHISLIELDEKYYKISKDRTSGVMERTFSEIFSIKDDVITTKKRMRTKPNKYLKPSKSYEGIFKKE